MDPSTATIILEIVKVTPKAIEVIVKENALDEINKKLDQVIAKQDQTVLSQIKSAYDAIYGALASHNEATRSQRLSYAENTLLPNTQLSSGLEIAGLPSGYWMALANYGLAIICQLRSDQQTEAIHFLKMFEADPRTARISLQPELYEKFFKPQCQAAYDWFEQRKREIVNANYSGTIALEKLGAAALVLAGIGAGVVFRMGPAVGQAVGPTVRELWKDATPDKHRANDLQEAEAERERRIDQRCKEIARQYL